MSSKRKPKFVKINKTLDREHDKMLKAADKLYDECYKHWKTEEEMYQEGLHQMPFEHKNISKEWAAHQKQHKNFLKQIKTLKKHIIMHIKKYDTRDFHWTM